MQYTYILVAEPGTGPDTLEPGLHLCRDSTPDPGLRARVSGALRTPGCNCR